MAYSTSLVLNGIGHLLNDFHRAIADGTDSLQQVDDVFFIIGKFVNIEQVGDRRVFGFLLCVLVENLFQDRAIAASSSSVTAYP